MTQPKKRIPLIDLCRGLLIFMMTARHTISLLEISTDHWLYKYFLPSGWATVCFISLSGFSIGMLYFEQVREPILRHQLSLRLRKRSWQLLIVMFFSNLAMLIGKMIVQGEVSALRNINWWIGLLTLKTPYSISSILIPTALLVFVAPEFLRLILLFKAIPMLMTWTLVALVTSGIISNVSDPASYNYLMRRLLLQADGYYPILPMVLYGAISMTLGTIWKTKKVSIIFISIILYYGAVFLFPKSELALVTLAAISGPVRLVILNFFSMLLLQLRYGQHITGFLCTIGRFSLLSFILHRVILQGLVIILTKIQPSSLVEFHFFTILLLTIGAVWMVCDVRLRHPKVNSVLKFLYI